MVCVSVSWQTFLHVARVGVEVVVIEVTLNTTEIKHNLLTGADSCDLLQFLPNLSTLLPMSIIVGLTKG